MIIRSMFIHNGETLLEVATDGNVHVSVCQIDQDGKRSEEDPLLFLSRDEAKDLIKILQETVECSATKIAHSAL